MPEPANLPDFLDFEGLMRILVAEDDPAIARHVSETLTLAGYSVLIVDNGPEVWDMGETETFAAIVLDLGLPGMDGMSILRHWRKGGLETPVLVLTARGSWMERVDGFDAGADDYLPKPFRSEELLARLRAVLRRSRKVVQNVKTAGRFILDDSLRRVTFDGRIIEVSPLEYRMIACLVDRKGEVVTQMDLANAVQGRSDDAAKNAVEAMIGRLRRKTDNDAIETRRGFGYLLPELPT
jgi:two-component system, OmpR family, response regulator